MEWKIERDEMELGQNKENSEGIDIININTRSHFGSFFLNFISNDFFEEIGFCMFCIIQAFGTLNVAF